MDCLHERVLYGMCLDCGLLSRDEEPDDENEEDES